MALERYRAKRDFDVTQEPRGKKGRAKGSAFVIQKHAASRLHYDLRLELDGVMKSWAVTRGPSLNPGDKRLAIHVEDHPIDYNSFEGTIPAGEYGGGTVMIWDRGEWIPEGDPHRAYKKGHLEFRLAGEKLAGSWHLVRMHKRDGERQDPWLLIKSDDEAARGPKGKDILEEMPLSVASGRSMDEITAGKPVRKRSARKRVPAKAVWSSNRKPAAAKEKVARTPARRPRAKRAAPRAAARGSKAKSSAKGKRAARGHTAGDPATLPSFVEPCLTQSSEKAPDAEGWLHEIKFDGYRIQARIESGKAQLKTRRGLDWTEKFGPVAATLAELPVSQALVDGEIVVETSKGISSFSALQEALSNGGGNFVFYAFDLLHLDGRDITRLPLIERKDALAPLIQELDAEETVRLSEHFEVEGSVLLQHACKLSLEGIISKRRDAPYRSGRGGDWLKTKCSERQEFVIVGYAPATSNPKAVGALIVGYYQDEELQYAGRVGTGFTQKTSIELWRKLAPLTRRAAPFTPLPEEERGRPGVWVEPKLVAEVNFRGWTHGTRLRHPSFVALRDDKLAREVGRDSKTMPAAASKKSATGAAKKAPKNKSAPAKPRKPAAAPAAEAHLTNPDRVYWEDVGLTKQGLADYYASVWDWIKPHVCGRVLSLVRCPEGVKGQCFFQKHASAGLDAKQLRMVPEDGDRVIGIDDLDGLLALVQAGVLEIHVRGSRIEHLGKADRIVFDLDPAPEVEWKELLRATREVRERLEELKLVSYLKTTGGKGLHVVVPITPAPWDDVKAFTRAFAFAMAADSPERYIATASKKERTGRTFIDYLRNSHEATAICAYSTRARDGATVSAPIDWSELGTLRTAGRYTVENLASRLARLKRDPWADIAREKQRLPKMPRGSK